MLQTVMDTCEFKQDAIDFALTKQIEDLSDLIGHDQDSAEKFFDKTFVTEGMALLIRQGLQRLAGQNDQAIFELRQAMGGGKTHSMLALGYLAANPSITSICWQNLTLPFCNRSVASAALNGRAARKIYPAQPPWFTLQMSGSRLANQVATPSKVAEATEWQSSCKRSPIVAIVPGVCRKGQPKLNCPRIRPSLM